MLFEVFLYGSNAGFCGMDGTLDRYSAFKHRYWCAVICGCKDAAGHTGDFVPCSQKLKALALPANSSRMNVL